MPVTSSGRLVQRLLTLCVLCVCLAYVVSNQTASARSCASDFSWCYDGCRQNGGTADECYRTCEGPYSLCVGHTRGPRGGYLDVPPSSPDTCAQASYSAGFSYNWCVSGETITHPDVYQSCISSGGTPSECCQAVADAEYAYYGC